MARQLRWKICRSDALRWRARVVACSVSAQTGTISTEPWTADHGIRKSRQLLLIISQR